MDREQRKKKGEIRENSGFSIVNSFGGLWGNAIFDSPEEALAYLKKNYPTADVSKFRLAMAVQTTEICRPMGEPAFMPMPER